MNIISPKACVDLLVNQDKVSYLFKQYRSTETEKEELKGPSIEVVEYSWWELYSIQGYPCKNNPK